MLKWAKPFSAFQKLMVQAYLKPAAALERSVMPFRAKEEYPDSRRRCLERSRLLSLKIQIIAYCAGFVAVVVELPLMYFYEYSWMVIMVTMFVMILVIVIADARAIVCEDRTHSE